MAIGKDIAIHGDDGVDNCVDYITNSAKSDIEGDLSKFKGKGLTKSSGGGDVDRVFGYAENLEKTVFELDGDEDLLISGVGCSVETASFQFQLDRDKYYYITAGLDKRHAVYGQKEYVDKETGEISKVNKQSIEAYHVIQSFEADPNLDPRLVHHLGVLFAERAFPGHKCVVSTHMNTDHLHNHIVMCAYNENGHAKYHMNKEHRNAYRAINDEISLEYGLPILLDRDPEKKNLGVDWYEWATKDSTSSWKDKVRDEIKEAIGLASSWDEFVAMMEQNGTEVVERGKHLTFKAKMELLNEPINAIIDPKTGEPKIPKQKSDKELVRRVRDDKLGPAFDKISIMKAMAEQHPKLKEQIEEEIRGFVETEPKLKDDPLLFAPKVQTKVVSLYVGRYTDTGRRRSDLEIILLKAIKLIKFFKDMFAVPSPTPTQRRNAIYQPSSVKLRSMEQSLYMCQVLGIESVKDLKDRMNTTGSELSHLRKEAGDLERNAEYAQDLLDKIDNYVVLSKHIEDIGFDTANLFIDTPTEEEKHKASARALPMTSKQRRDLYMEVENHPEWKLKYKFDYINYNQAQDIIAFFRGHAARPTDLVITEAEFDQSRIEKKYEAVRAKKLDNMFQRWGDKEPSPAMLKRIKTIADEQGWALRPDTLSYFDIHLLLQYLAENKFAGELASVEDRAKVQSLADMMGVKLCRDIRYLLASEVSEVINYLNTGKGAMPDILKPAQEISPSIKAQIDELLELRGDHCVIPTDQLSMADASVLYDYLLFKEYKPACILPDKSKIPGDVRFEEELLKYPLSEHDAIVTYRNLVHDLMLNGIDIDKPVTDSVKISHEAIIGRYEEIKAEVESKANDYKQLQKLNYNLQMAQTPAFTNGPLYTQKSTEKARVLESESVTKEVKNEEKQINDDIKRRNLAEQTQKNGNFFSGINDLYFDRM